MIQMMRVPTAALCVLASLLISCSRSDSGDDHHLATAQRDDDKLLNFYTWSDYIAPDTIASFQKLTGIKVNVSYFNSNEMLEAQMLTGHSGFDVIVVAGPYFQRQIRSGAYQPLDKKQPPNLVNLDPSLMAQAALNDPGNVYGVIYTWGTYGIGYNEQKVAQALPNTPVKSWGLIFDPMFAAKLAPCGINLVDTPAGVTRAALKYLGRNPNEPSAQDLKDVETVLTKIRPYIRNMNPKTTSKASQTAMSALPSASTATSSPRANVPRRRKTASESASCSPMRDLYSGLTCWPYQGCAARRERPCFHQLSYESPGHRNHFRLRRLCQRQCSGNAITRQVDGRRSRNLSAAQRAAETDRALGRFSRAIARYHSHLAKVQDWTIAPQRPKPQELRSWRDRKIVGH